MGNWQLEIFKFSLYVFAPVASFYIYHKVWKFDLGKLQICKFPTYYFDILHLKSSMSVVSNFQFLFQFYGLNVILFVVLIIATLGIVLIVCVKNWLKG